ncbi:MAG: transcriptional regulator [Actinomycetota bacterium]|nr:transcriptional regulator [Actinomycetota bacterium]
MGDRHVPLPRQRRSRRRFGVSSSDDTRTIDAMRRVVEDDAERYALLADPRRRQIYLALRQSGRALTKDDVADSLAISRTLATFHLEKLLEGGFLAAHFAHPEPESSASSGGGGRRAKYYRPTNREVALGIPPRRYDVAADVLARAVVTADAAISPTQRALELAHAKGREAGEEFRAEDARRRQRGVTRDEFVRLLGELGYEPRVVGREILLGNCPFDALVVPPYLVCEMNQRLVQGALEGCQAGRLEPVAGHRDGHCCVVVAKRPH